MQTSAVKCYSCGANIYVDLNVSRVFCTYCGTQNIVSSEQMKMDVRVGNIGVQGNTEVAHMKSAARFAIDSKQYDKANDLLMASIISGSDDFEIYVLKAMIDLHTDDNGSLFRCLERLWRMEWENPSQELRESVYRLMQYRGKNGVQPLHNAAFHERMDLVIYCTEHGADVNAIAGMNRVSPISIMFVPISSSQSKLDGTPFVRDKQKVKEIRKYLMDHGARDPYRFGY